MDLRILYNTSSLKLHPKIQAIEQYKSNQYFPSIHKSQERLNKSNIRGCRSIIKGSSFSSIKPITAEELKEIFNRYKKHNVRLSIKTN